MVVEGKTAPDFDLPSDSGHNIKLSKLKGRPVVVYFYPKDDTSGCTAEAIDFNRLAADFAPRQERAEEARHRDLAGLAARLMQARIEGHVLAVGGFDAQSAGDEG